MIEHRSVIRLVKNNEFISLSPQDNVLSLSPFVFDGSIFDIFGSLLNGSSLIVPIQEEVLDFTKLNSLIEKEKVSVFFITTALFNSLVDSAFFTLDTVRSIMFGGELVSVPHVEKFKNKYSTIELLHVYGPTENTTFSTYHSVLEADLSKSTIPIGIPISNSTAYILGASNGLQPIGVVGEICLGGAGLARGYLNNEALTSEKFIEHPFKDGERLYKTGDLGRWLSDGTIEFVGRVDDQVKIRGHRIELGEIESVVQGYSGVSSNVVLVRELSTGDKELVSYVVGATDVDELQSYLSGILPGYMIPRYFVMLDSMPLNSNGKIDKKSLPDPDGVSITDGFDYVAPRNKTEEKLVEIWSDVLGISKEEISVKSNFFDLGGHSLKVVKLYGIIYKEFEVKVDIEQLFDLPSLESQAKCIEGKAIVEYQEIPQAPKAESYVLSSSQRRLWVLSQFDSANVAYNVPMVHVTEDLDVGALEQAFTSLILRHESLRTVFRQVEGEDIRQFINPGFDFKLVTEDLRGLSSEDQRSRVNSFCYLPFDLSTGPLLRGALYRISGERYVYVYVMHHIISDELSLEVLFKELMFFYDGYHHRGSPSLPALRIHYKDYSVWQQQDLLSGNLSASALYWNDQFRGDVPVLSLATDYVRPPFKTYSGGVVSRRIEASIFSDFRSLIEDRGCTMFMGVLSLVYALLYKYTGDRDIILGSPISGRDHVDLEGQIGFYVNTLALRTLFENTDSFSDLLGKVKEVALGAYNHQLYPFDELVDSLSLSRDTSRNPLFDVMVTYQRIEAQDESNSDDLDNTDFGSIKDQIISKFDLSFGFREIGDDLTIGIVYNSDLFKAETIERLCQHLQQLLNALVYSPDENLENINYLIEKEQSQILNEFNNTDQEYSKDKTIDQLFEEQVERSPDHVALQFELDTLTYSELNQRANQLARQIRKEYKARTNTELEPSTLIGLYLDRSMEMVIGLLAILKAGGAYVPIDPEYPEGRINYILDDTNLQLILSQIKFENTEILPAEKLLNIDLSEDFYQNEEGSNLMKISGPKDLAYVIFTSGTTGQPKGAELLHTGIVNRIEWMQSMYTLGEDDVVLQKTPYVFDVSVWEFFWAHWYGAKLVLAIPGGHKDCDYLQDVIAKQGVTTLHFVPSMLEVYNQYLIAEGFTFNDSIRQIISSGEALGKNTVVTTYQNSKSDQFKLHNLYGPTEASIDVTYYETSPDKEVYIGKPIQNTQLYILDSKLNPVPIGVLGELYIGGVGLAKGYLNKKELTETRFINNPFVSEEDKVKGYSKIYKTGDVVRWMPDGTIEFVGRMDDQVKIRGYRIELGEIESVLQGYVGISSCIVLAKELSIGEKELIGYVVGEGIDIDEIRNYLRSILPVYMIPGYFVLLDAIPLTSNGKVDRKSLPDPDGTSVAGGVDFVAPRNEIEEKLVEIWSDVLRISKEDISVKANFFELGGHSLKIVKLYSIIYKAFKVKINIEQLFNLPSLESQAMCIEGETIVDYQEIPQAQKAESYVLSSSQRRLWILGQFDSANVAHNMPMIHVIEDIDVGALERAFTSLISRHESLRTVFREVDGEDVCQFINPAFDFKLVTEDLGEMSLEDQRFKVNSFSSLPFDLSVGPLLRGALYRISADRQVFVCVMHHIISDDLSMEVLFKELMFFYEGYSQGTSPSLPPLRLQYKDYSVWQQQELSSGNLSTSALYWKDQFSGELPVIDLATDYVRPAFKSYSGGYVRCNLEDSMVSDFRSLLEDRGCTMFMGVLSLFNALLYKYTGDQDIILGSPISGRDHVDLEGQIGFYVNMLALRTRFEESDSFSDLLGKVKKVALEAYSHQLYPFDELVDGLSLSRETSRHPLFDIVVSYHVLDKVTEENEHQEGHNSDSAPPDYDSYYSHTISKSDLMLSVVDNGVDLHIGIEYSSDLFTRATIDRMSVHLGSLLSGLLASPETGIREIEYLGAKEKEKLLFDFNNTDSEYPKDSNIVSLFESQAEERPSSIALVFEGSELTYGELDSLSNQFAHYLVSHYTTGSDVLIGVKLDRSIEMLVSILGILKSGSAYVPIDPEYPQDRIDYMLSDSACEALIDTDEYSGFRADQSSYSDASLALSIDASDLCYVIYTSGSTGHPKGVMIEHRSVIRLVKNNDFISLSPQDNVLSLSPFVFDGSIFDIFGSLLNGSSLIVPNRDEVLDFSKLNSLIEKEKVSVFFITTALFNTLVDSTFFTLDTVRSIMFGGELVSVPHVKKFKNTYSTIELLHVYGPTENTTFSTYHSVLETDLSKSTIPIGSPISNSTAYVLGTGNGLQPIGVVGEICLGGDGLARGYLNNEALTLEKFISHPFKEGERLYKTGDLGRWLDDGTIEFVGREDDQVKIRGHRIELGEIESVVQGYVGVSSCVVLTRELSAGDREIVSYVVGDGVDVEELRHYLQGILPVYMIPGYFVLLDAIPLNSNGKVDKKSLPDPDGASITSGVAYVAPRNEIEEKLVEIWSTVLEIPKEEISVKSNFFELGGHSLKVVKLYGIIYKEFEVKVDIEQLFDLPSLESQAQCIGGEAIVDYQEIPQAPLSESYVLSSSQRRLWVLSQFDSANVAYNVPMVQLIEGLDVGALERAFTSLISRHESLRTVFREVDGEDIRQFINPAFDFKLVTEDLEALLPEEQRSRVNSFCYLPFDLSTGPLLRGALYRISEGRHVFVYVMHHIISDELSLGVLFKELMFFYEGYRQGGSPSLPPLRLQYKDFSVWQQQELLSGELSTSASYWKGQFSGKLPILNLGTDYVRPLIKTYSGGVVSCRLQGSIVSGFRALLDQRGCTMFMGVLSLVNTLLYKYTGDQDIILGSPISGRDHVDLEGQIGFYVNMLALRTRFENTDSFSDLLGKVKDVALSAYSHQLYPFDELVDGLSLARDTSRHPLFDVIVSYHVLEQVAEEKNNQQDQEASSTEKDKVTKYTYTTSKSDLLFNIADKGDNLDIDIEYSSDLFTRATIERMLVHIESLMSSLIDAPDVSLKDINYLSVEERERLLIDFNDTNTEYPKESNLVNLFESQVKERPKAIALTYEGDEMSYGELDNLSNQFAHYLVSRYTTGSDVLIGVKLDRSLEMLVAILGILKSGSAYVPIDPEYPQERISYMIKDSGCEALIDAKEYAGFESDQSSYSDLSLELSIDASDLCYVIYTSGSTGRPKGVMIEHGNVVNFISTYKLEQHRSTLTCNYVFDVSVMEIFANLTSGSALYIPNNEVVMDPEKYAEFIYHNKISHCYIHPMHLVEIATNLATYDVVYLKRILIGVQSIKVSDVNWYHENNINIINAYGPTECTIYSTSYKVDNLDNIASLIIPIGGPISNSSAYILDDSNGLLPIGVVGEICLGGDGVARGYLNNAVLTSEKFILNPFRDGERLYKTGDLGRWLDDGTIEFVGRIDDQVKIRGYRIELGEIQSVVQEYSGVSSSVVLARELSTGDKELVAYVVGDGVDVGKLRGYLRGILPNYMIPGYFVLLDSIPLTSNGKIDKRSLPDPDGASITTGIEYIAPRNAVEEKLVEIWSDVLGIPKEEISVKSNFFELGGHSLKVLRLSGVIHKEFEVKISVQDLFNSSSLESQSMHIGRETVFDYQEISQAPLSESYILSSSQRRLWVLSQFDSANVAYNMHMVQLIEGVDVGALEQAFTSLISRHESLRTVFREVDGGDIRQIINPAFDFKLVIEDLEGMSSEEQRSKVNSFSYLPFHLAEGPLLRGALYRISAGHHVFVYVMHHIISDELSLKVLFNELMFFYEGYLHGGSPSLPALRIHYKDYSVWQQQELLSGNLSASALYWKNQFQGDIPVLNLVTDYVRPTVKTYSGGFVNCRLQGSIVSDFRSLLEHRSCTMFMGVLSLVNALLYKYTGDQDIIIGSPISGRDHVDLEGQIGFYVNTLALRTRFENTDSFSDLLGKVKEVALGDYSHQMYPFDELVDGLSLPRDTSRNPLFDVLVTYQRIEAQDESNSDDLDNTDSGSNQDHIISKFDLSFGFGEIGDDLTIGIEYNSDLFAKATIDRMLVHLEGLLGSLVASPMVPISDLSFISDKEQFQLLHDFNDTSVAYPVDSNLVVLFESQVLQSPESIALVYKGSSLTYGELDVLSNQFAHYLVSRYTTGSDVLIGVILDRSIEMVVTILGILKSGSAYVPIDPEYPQQRIDYMVRDSGCEVVIDTEEYAGFQTKQSSYSDLSLSVSIDSSDMVYIVYTSGSTGRPKGVMIEHGNVNAFLHWSYQEFENSEFDKMLFGTSICFDISIFEMFFTLTTGKILEILDNGLSIPEYLNSAHRLMINTVPSVVGSLLSSKVDFSNVSVLNMAGESIPAHYLDSLLGRVGEIRNFYGPSEDTTYSTVFRIDSRSKILIGRPVSNTQVFIVNPQGLLQPIGVVGEICLGGAGLARGYLNNDALTLEKFISHPFKEGERMYKTGDLGMWLSDGMIDFVGRMDDQVKVRGYRIELGEIESVLQGHVGISSSVVLAKELSIGEKELVGYVVGEDLDIGELRSYLSGILPDYMIPGYFVLLDAMPLTANGKIDKRSLPDPDEASIATGVDFIAPRNAIEEQFVTRWKEVLGIKIIGIDDDFFHLGGNSIKAIRACKIDDLNVPLRVLYKERTIRKCVEQYKNYSNPEEVLFEYNYSEEKNMSILLIPYSGATDIVYWDLANELSDNYNVYLVSFPWHSLNYKEDFKSAEWILNQLFKEINQKVKTSQIVVAGHCAGTNLALALSYKLKTSKFKQLGLIQCAAINYLNLNNIQSSGSKFLAHYSDEQLWEDLILLLGTPGITDEKIKSELVRNFRYDAEIAISTMMEIKNNSSLEKLNIPIHAIYGENDPTTKGYAEDYKGWLQYSEKVTYNQLDSADHYFVNNRIKDTQKAFSKIIKEWEK